SVHLDRSLATGLLQLVQVTQQPRSHARTRLRKAFGGSVGVRSATAPKRFECGEAGTVPPATEPCDSRLRLTPPCTAELTAESWYATRRYGNRITAVAGALRSGVQDAGFQLLPAALRRPAGAVWYSAGVAYRQFR